MRYFSWQLRRISLFIFFLGIMPSFSSAYSISLQHTQLSNGMDVYVAPDHRSPVVSHMLMYYCGSVDEKSNKTGLAHLLEHLMFRGTPTISLEQFSQELDAMGGYFNASTSTDWTNYYEVVGRESLERVMFLEADRMRHLTIDDESFSQELRIVSEERRLRTDDVPRWLLFEQLMSSHFSAHHYRHPIVGWMRDLDNMEMKDAQDWYDDWYQPNNALLVVVGDVNPEEVFQMAEKIYGSLPVHISQRMTERRSLISTETDLPDIKKYVEMYSPMVESPQVIVLFSAPVVRDWHDKDEINPYALCLFKHLISAEPSFVRRYLIKDKQLASEWLVDYDLFNRGPGLFAFFATAGSGVSSEDLQAGIDRSLELFIKEGVSEIDLQWAKTQVRADTYFQRDSLARFSLELMYIASTGLNPQYYDTVLENILAVTAEQVILTAKKVLYDSLRTVGHLLPESERLKNEDKLTKKELWMSIKRSCKGRECLSLNGI